MGGKIGVNLGLGLAIGLAGAGAIAPARAEPGPPVVTVNAADGVAEGQLVLPFTDVPTDHWAYQALLNLAGVHGCLSGYPDHTFRGNNSLSRYEFAAGLESCLTVVNTLLQQRQSQTSQTVNQLREAMQQSWQELRQLEGAVPETL